MLAPELSRTQAVFNSEKGEDTMTKTRTVYDVSAFEVIWRNFLAGMSRALGSIIMYFLFFTIIATFVGQVVWPRVKPLYDSTMRSMQKIEKLEDNADRPIQIQIPNQGGDIRREDLQMQLNQYQNSEE